VSDRFSSASKEHPGSCRGSPASPGRPAQSVSPFKRVRSAEVWLDMSNIKITGYRGRSVRGRGWRGFEGQVNLSSKVGGCGCCETVWAEGQRAIWEATGLVYTPADNHRAADRRAVCESTNGGNGSQLQRQADLSVKGLRRTDLVSSRARNF